jgi:hypothetical protein
MVTLQKGIHDNELLMHAPVVLAETAGLLSIESGIKTTPVRSLYRASHGRSYTLQNSLDPTLIVPVPRASNRQTSDVRQAILAVQLSRRAPTQATGEVTPLGAG